MSIYVEENQVYQIDCSAAVWSTDLWHSLKNNVCGTLRDVDWIIEDKDVLYLVEYKNANVAGAANPGAYNPHSDKAIKKLVEKYLDTLHYLNVKPVAKPRHYVCILEYPKGDSVSRRLIRNELKKRLFFLQEQQGSTHKIIHKIDVVDIQGWNANMHYRKFPITRVVSQQNSGSSQ